MGVGLISGTRTVYIYNFRKEWKILCTDTAIAVIDTEGWNTTLILI